MMSSTLSGFMDPAATITHFHLREGDMVGDFGAGVGYYARALSKVVGQSGRVYACEIQRNLVEKLGILVHEERLANVHPLWCDLEKPQGIKIKDGLLDAGVLVNTLFQFEAKDVALKEIARVIRKGGKFFVIDWTDSFGGLGPQSRDVVREEEAKELVQAAGFTFERSFPAAQHHYGLAFRKE